MQRKDWRPRGEMTGFIFLLGKIKSDSKISSGDVGFPSLCHEHVLLPMISKEAVSANG